VERAFKLRNISIRNEITEFSSKFESLRFALQGNVLTLKLACATVGVQNRVERPFNRRDISVRNEITEFSSELERLRFAICRDCSDAEIGVRYFRRVEWRGKGV
jgi:hypothetical protein